MQCIIMVSFEKSTQSSKNLIQYNIKYKHKTYNFFQLLIIIYSKRTFFHSNFHEVYKFYCFELKQGND